MRKTAIIWASLTMSANAQAQTCHTTMTLKAPDSRYIVQAGGTEVLDTGFGEQWNGEPT